jgi:hypothetical protein
MSFATAVSCLSLCRHSVLPPPLTPLLPQLLYNCFPRLLLRLLLYVLLLLCMCCRLLLLILLSLLLLLLHYPVYQGA